MAQPRARAAFALSETSGALGDAKLRAANAREVYAFLATDAVGLAQLRSDDFVANNALNKAATKLHVLASVKGRMLSLKTYDQLIGRILHDGNMATPTWSGAPRKDPLKAD